MNIGNVSSALSAINASEPSSLMESVGVKMLDKSLDASVSMNDSMIRMMENSVTPYLGGNIDVSV
ncbi:MAG: YjfB family protein [Lachnobacterium sp.]|nr:YjfB family protein [Lachnobacterium sp.]MCI7533001.1 YjfB family protein [Lachnobacterium sp.]MDD7713056.1 YjfB family protein [Lachnobacterium sp.]MDY5460685.1 YjfB family protein [Agathobacter sp.]